MNRGATAQIDLHAIASNLKEVKRITKNRAVIAVVKADGYGHGSVSVSRFLEKQGISMLATAFTEEAVTLRECGIKTPILVLFDRTDIKSFFDLNLMPVIHDLKTLRLLSKEARERGVILNVHLKVDTGMGRMGFNEPKEIIKALNLSSIRVSGLMSHFSEADIGDKEYAEEQLKQFHEIKNILFKEGIKPLCHIANSAAVMGMPESHLDAVRPGLMLYGVSPYKKGVSALLPAMKVYTTILALRRLKKGQSVSYGRTFITTRKTLAAVLPIGYADGYMRAFSNNCHVLIKGRSAAVIGRVCMDLTVVDVTDIKDAAEGDTAVLLGSDGKETISAGELAQRAGTIPYEILTSLGSRAKRVYIGQ